MTARQTSRIARLIAGIALVFASAAQAVGTAMPTDKELQKFVAASVAVHRISEASEAEQKKTKSPRDAAKIEDAASDKMEQAVVAHGLTTDRYTEIFDVMQKNPKVHARVTQLAKAQTGNK